MVKIEGGDGSSFEKAIIISDCNDMEGVKQEYIELRKRFGNYKLINQTLMDYKDKLYDKLKVSLDTNKEIDVFFDITNFFVKGFEI